MTRNEEIHSKGFNMSQDRYSYRDAPETLDFNKIKVGVKNLDDAVLDLGSIKKVFPRHPYGDKSLIFKAIAEKDIPLLRLISNFFYNTSGIYSRVCNYFAFLYRYDWYMVPQIDDDAAKEEKILKDFNKLLNYFDNSNIKKICGDIALAVIKNGAYYGYLVKNPKGIVLQELPNAYCRSRYTVGGNPAVEFNMRFFDTFSDINYRMKVLNLFPEEFKKGYLLYKKGKLKQDDFNTIDSFPARGIRREPLTDGWYLLEHANTVKFNFNGSDIPLFINAIPSIIDLDAAQDLDRRKQMQKLLKIVIQKLPMDKNGDLIFVIDEARDIHSNAVEMLKRAVGVDVLTTFADVDSIDMSDKNTTTSKDDLEKVERTVFNSLGISQNLFNTDGNLSLEKSILNDESSVRNLLLQFEMFFQRMSDQIGASRKKYGFKFYFLETTQYNYKELSKLYKEQTQLGYSKMLPQIALGHSQSFILNTAHFENEVLHLTDIMIPPMSSNTMSGTEILGAKDKTNNQNNDKKVEEKKVTVTKEEKKNGRPEKPDDEKAEKTIQNKESMS